MVAGGTGLSDSKCLRKLRQWEAKQYFAVLQPNVAKYSWPDFKVAVGERGGKAEPSRPDYAAM